MGTNEERQELLQLINIIRNREDPWEYLQAMGVDWLTDLFGEAAQEVTTSVYRFCMALF